MKVKELIKELEQFDKEMEVCFEDYENGDTLVGSVVAKKHCMSPPVTYCLIRQQIKEAEG